MNDKLVEIDSQCFRFSSLEGFAFQLRKQWMFVGALTVAIEEMVAPSATDTAGVPAEALNELVRAVRERWQPRSLSITRGCEMIYGEDYFSQ